MTSQTSSKHSVNPLTGRDGALIPIKIHKIDPASFGVFTECFDDVCDVTRFPHCRHSFPVRPRRQALSEMEFYSSEECMLGMLCSNITAHNKRACQTMRRRRMRKLGEKKSATRVTHLSEEEQYTQGQQQSVARFWQLIHLSSSPG